MRYKAPKTIIEHPAVEECIDGLSCGDYKHDVFLKEGWVFKFGRMEGCRGGMFHTVSDFKDAHPIKK